MVALARWAGRPLTHQDGVWKSSSRIAPELVYSEWAAHNSCRQQPQGEVQQSDETLGSREGVCPLGGRVKQLGRGAKPIRRCAAVVEALLFQEQNVGERGIKTGMHLNPNRVLRMSERHVVMVIGVGLPG